MASPQKTTPSVQYVQLGTDLSTVGSPPAGQVWLGQDSGGDPAGKLPDGTIVTIGSGGGSVGPWNEVRLVDDGTNGFTSIQAAHDDLPAFADGGMIVVSAAYDADTSETFPITITKPVVVQGLGWGQNQGVVTTNTTDTIFALDLASNFGRSAIQFYNLRIDGGNIGVELQNANRAEFRGCLIHDQTTNNVNFVNDGFTGWVLFDHCLLANAGGVGVDMRVPAGNIEPNATWFYGTSIGDAGAQGLIINGQGSAFIGGSVEGCQGEGILATGATSNPTILGAYFEQNGQSTSNINPGNGVVDADICLTGSYGASIGWTFHTDAGTNPAQAILDYDGNYTYINGIKGSNVIVNLQFPLEPTVGYITPQGSISNIGGTRPRVNGLGQASGNAEEPDASNWHTGETVDWTDTGDGSGDGLYRLGHGGNWRQIA